MLAFWGCRPNSLCGSNPTYILGIWSIYNFPKLLAYQTPCIYKISLQVTFLNILCCSCMVAPKVAKSVTEPFLLGDVFNSSHLSLLLSAVKRFGIGCVDRTGIPSSPHFAHTGSNPSSMATLPFMSLWRNQDLCFKSLLRFYIFSSCLSWAQSSVPKPSNLR
jgi:hypothetical protein